MSKFRVTVAACLMIVPGPLMAAQEPIGSIAPIASTAEFAYSKYVLSENDRAAIMNAMAVSCPTKSDGAGSIFAAEARYQTACLGKQVVRLEKRHKRDYTSAKSDLSEQSKRDYSAEYLGWVSTRYADCERDRNENLGGAMKNAFYNSCRLSELKRRAKWRGVSY